MFDPQTSALAAQTDIGRGATRRPCLFIVFCHSVKKSGFICEICGQTPAFKIKNLRQKIKTSSSNPIKPNQGFIDEKNSVFFSGRFYGKSLANHAKTAKKNLKMGQKTRDL